MTLADSLNPALGTSGSNTAHPIQPIIINKLPAKLAPGEFKASRVCKPGVMKTNFDGKPNCLVIGDSIALG